MVTYRVRFELHIKHDIGLYGAFGLYAYRRHRLLFHIPDVFFRKAQASRFAALCNREQPAFIHLFDILEDWL